MKHMLKRRSSKISGWFRRNNTLMAQAKDLSRQLQEAWREEGKWQDLCYTSMDEANNLTLQLHRVARERDQEREKRLAAEDALIDMYLEEAENEEE